MYKFDNDEYFKGKPAVSLLIALVGGLFVFAALSQILLSFGFSALGFDVEQWLSAESLSSEQSLLIGVFNGLVLIITMGGAAFLVMRLDKKQLTDLNGKERVVAPTIFVSAFFLIYYSTSVSDILVSVNSRIPFPEWVYTLQDQTDLLMVKILSGVTHPAGMVILFVVVGVIPALFEELAFRGVMQNLFHKATADIHLSIFITGALFSAFHFQFLGFLPRMFLGVVLGYMYYWSRNIWFPIFGHLCFNGFSLVMVFVMQRMGKSVEELSQEVPEISGMSVVISGVLFLLIFAFYQRSCWISLNSKRES